MTAKTTKAAKTTYHLLEIPINEVLSRFKLNKIFDPNLSDKDFENMVSKLSSINFIMYSFVIRSRQDKDGKVYVNFGTINEAISIANSRKKLTEESILECKDTRVHFELESTLESIEEIQDFLAVLRTKFNTQKKLLDARNLEMYGPEVRIKTLLTLKT